MNMCIMMYQEINQRFWEKKRVKLWHSKIDSGKWKNLATVVGSPALVLVERMKNLQNDAFTGQEKSLTVDKMKA